MATWIWVEKTVGKEEEMNLGKDGYVYIISKEEN